LGNRRVFGKRQKPIPENRLNFNSELAGWKSQVLSRFNWMAPS